MNVDFMPRFRINRDFDYDVALADVRSEKLTRSIGRK